MQKKSIISMPLLIEDLGMQFATSSSNVKRHYGIYECPLCDKYFRADFSKIKNRHTKSCGCYRAICMSNTMITHGLTGHKLYKTFKKIIDRVDNKKNKDFCNYGERGISICDEWRNDFILFYNWAINNGWKDSLSIDRINNDGNYEPSNCRWTTKTVQSRNRRVLSSKNTSGYRGVSFSNIMNKWKSSICVDRKDILLGYFEDKIKAAIAYNNYVTENSLEHTINPI